MFPYIQYSVFYIFMYNTLKVVQMKRDAGCDWMKWCLLGNIYKCTFTRIQRSF